MTNVLGATVTFAGFLAILKSYGLKLIGAPIGGVLADKMKSVSKFEIIAFGAMFVITLYISLAKGGSSLVTIFTVLTLVLATVCFMARGVMWASVDEAKVPKEISGTAMAVASIVGFNLPDICLPAIIGNWLDKYGNAAYSKVFTLLCGMCIAGMLAALAMVLLNKKEAKAANT